MGKGGPTEPLPVDLTRIHWYSRDPDETQVAPGIDLRRLPESGDNDALLLKGELDAVIDPNVLPSISRKDPRVHRLFRDYKTEEQCYFKATGIFPISHLITLRQEFVNSHPEAPVALLESFRRARDVALDRIQGFDPQIILVSWVNALLDEQRDLMGENYWAYNVKDNRQALEGMTRFAHQQGVTPQRIAYEDLFSPDAAEFPGQ